MAERLSDMCVNCQDPFETRSKGYKRYNIQKMFMGKKLTEYLDVYFIPYSLEVPQFLCHMCYHLLTKSVVASGTEEEFFTRSKTGKRKNIDRTPVKTPRRLKRQMVDVGVSPFTPGKRVMSKKISSWKSKAISAIQQSRYGSAFRWMLKSKAVRRALQRLVKLEVRREAAAYSRGDRELSRPVTQDSLHEFCWPEIIKEIREHLPFLYAALSGTLTNRSNEFSKLRITVDGKFGPSIPQMGTVFGMLMYARHPRKFSFLQEINALEMWSSGCRQKLYQCFQHMGISKGIKGAVSSVDRLRGEFDHQIKQWKREIEGNTVVEQERPQARVQLFEGQTENDESDLDLLALPYDDVIDDRVKTLSLDETLPYMEEDDDKPEIPKHPGFCIVWDNVQVMSTVRHQTSEKQNKMLMWALSYAALNRIGFQHLEGTATVRAQDMPLFYFLPNQDDYDNLRVRMEVMVTRILKKYMKAFQDSDVLEHVPHDYSEESSGKTKLVNLGVLDENPSSTAGVIAILDHLHQYVPTKDDNLFVIPCHGDGLSVERMRDAKAARSASETNEGRLEGLEPVPQEFHKRCILLQDTVDEFYSGSSGADRGTLFHIRNTFNHRNVTRSVNSSFNPIVDLLGFTTEGLVILLATKICDITTEQDVPTDLPADKDEKNEYFVKVAKRIVDTVWHQVSMNSINEVLEADDEEETDMTYYEFCICGDDIGDYMIKCSNNLCGRGNWFHITCLNISEADIPDGDWWCSDACKATQRSQYCICQTYSPAEPTVRCCRGDNCSSGKIFHLKCLKLKKKPGPKWLCISCSTSKSRKKEMGHKDDHIYLYTCALLWRGLLDQTYRDAIRENDGEIMITHWRIDMIEFWQKHHNKYLILGHKLLADVQGWLPERLRKEIMWNRTANIQGGPGHNIELDLVNEFLNCDFKENLKSGHGQYTKSNVARTSQFIGSLGKDLDRVFQKQIAGTWVKTQSGGRKDYSRDVGKFVREFQADNLFDIIPGREHSAYPGYRYNLTVSQPGKLKSRLKKYSFKLDISREILP